MHIENYFCVLTIMNYLSFELFRSTSQLVSVHTNLALFFKHSPELKKEIMSNLTNYYSYFYFIIIIHVKTCLSLTW